MEITSSTVEYAGIKLQFKYYSNDYIALDIKKNPLDICNSHILKILRMILKENDVVIDAGCHIGYISMFASKFVGKTGRVHSFELQPEIYRDCLLPNIIDNKLTNIHVYNCALGSKRELVSYSSPSLYGTEGHKNYGDVKTIIGGNTDLVLCSFIDELITDDVKLLKIDVQGMEMEVLKGAKHLLDKYHPFIIIEFEHYIDSYKSSNEEIINMLRLLGYNIYLLESNWPSDFICIHKDRMEEFAKNYYDMFTTRDFLSKYYIIDELKNLEFFKNGKQFELVDKCVRLNI